ncbi:unnamed protein product [Clonostachys byssicola]|uniref:Uncharacterized protein n=1 Tax=Clonostachys byssicola TaxID=160290 RepID=A0A9N9Y6Y8_9HYPO|nr:unnamed protein product [Clonostachys byssicola]
MWQLRFLKKLFPRPGNPGLNLFLYEVEHIHKLLTAPVVKKPVEASQPVLNRPTQARPTTPSFTPVPIKNEEDGEAACALIAEVPKKPPVPNRLPIKTEEAKEAARTLINKVPKKPLVPIIVLTTPGGQVVEAQNIPAWRKIEIPFHYRLKVKRELNNDKWLSPALCRRMRKKIRRRQMDE